MQKFQLSEFTRKGTDLLEKIRREFKNLNLDDSALPKNFGDDDAIKLVFVGQYGAGKSSLIKMLTGEEVSIGANITTQTAQAYPWNGLEIIDTPGIHTELHPDHDALTYEQINHAALLIFVITSEGFSQIMGEHFRELAVDQKRADNMILVVNKMDKTAMDNVPAQQEIIAADLEKVTQPYKPQDLFLSFVSTANYFDALDETDAEIKNELLELSGRDVFVDNLNRFAESHRLLAKISKPLYTTAQVLRDAIESNSADGDKDISEFVQTIQDRKNLLLDGKRQCLRDVRDIATSCRNEIVKLGREAANAVQPTNNKDAMEKTIRDAQLKVEEVVGSYGDKFEDCLKDSLKSIGEEMNAYNNTDFVKNVNLRIGNRIKIEQASSRNGAIGGALVSVGAIIAKFANPAAVAVGTPTTFAILAGKFVEAGAGFFLKGELGIFAELVAAPLGNFVQKILSPPPTFWQRMGAWFARNAGNIGKVLGAAGMAVAVGLEVKAANDAEKLENLLQTERERIMKNFDDVADEIYNGMNDNAKIWAEKNIGVIVTECDKAIKSVNDEREQSKVKADACRQLLKQTEDLIAEISSSKN